MMSHRIDENLPSPILDVLAKSRISSLLVIPVKTGIQYFQLVMCRLDSRRSLPSNAFIGGGNDDFLRICKLCHAVNSDPAPLNNP